MYHDDMNVRSFRAMVACWVIVLACWAGAWYLDWISALVSMLANGYFLLSLWFFWHLYPEKSRRD